MTKTATKTREHMLDVARQLFAKFGTQSTTMNEIAGKAKKGRRTLYTYFRNKEEILSAVIERELDTLYAALKEAHDLHLKPENRIMNFVYTHLESMRDIVFRNGGLRSDFFKDIFLVENARRDLDYKETILIQDILEQGVREDSFCIPDIETTARILLNTLKGLEVPYISSQIRHVGSDEFERIRQALQHIIIGGIGKQQHTETSS